MKRTDLHRIQQQIDAYRRGTLTDEEIDLLWAELIEYPDQLEYLINAVNLEAIAAREGVETYKTSSQKEKNGGIAKIYPLSRTWGRIAVVFAVVIGVMSATYFWGSEYVFEPGPVDEVELNSFRSSTIPSAVFDYDLQRAVNLAAMEQYDQALDKIEDIQDQNLTQEQKVSLLLNKGSVYYNQGDYYSAKEVFHRILKNHEDLHVLTREQIHWFLGNAYLQLEEEELARQHIQKTYDLNGAYRRMAERYLD